MSLYDSTWDWTPVFQTVGEHSNHYANEKVNKLVYMDDIQLLGENEKELENLLQTVRIYSQDIGMEFGFE